MISLTFGYFAEVETSYREPDDTGSSDVPIQVLLHPVPKNEHGVAILWLEGAHDDGTVIVVDVVTFFAPFGVDAVTVAKIV